MSVCIARDESTNHYLGFLIIIIKIFLLPNMVYQL